MAKSSKPKVKSVKITPKYVIYTLSNGKEVRFKRGGRQIIVPGNRSLDKKRIALPPGKRISRAGKIYYEYRSNRSDKNRRKKI